MNNSPTTHVRFLIVRPQSATRQIGNTLHQLIFFIFTRTAPLNLRVVRLVSTYPDRMNEIGSQSRPQRPRRQLQIRAYSRFRIVHFAFTTCRMLKFSVVYDKSRHPIHELIAAWSDRSGLRYFHSAANVRANIVGADAAAEHEFLGSVSDEHEERVAGVRVVTAGHLDGIVILVSATHVVCFDWI
uniref:Uncharacterized protein n=1 Tax=Strigamia maritima TaxID=126957 RepID=T1ILM7_STRMM